MYGRYGIDRLYWFMFGSSLVLSVSGIIVNFFAHDTIGGRLAYVIIEILSFSLLLLAVMRAFSRNYNKRRAENSRYLKIRNAIFKRKPKLPPDTSEYVFRRCKYCGVTLRLPNRQGKHTVKCVRCGKEFTVKNK